MYINGEDCTVVSKGINITVYDKKLEKFVSVVGFDADEKYIRYFGSVDAVNK